MARGPGLFFNMLSRRRGQPARLLPAQMEMMRHESIETTLRFYVGTDAQRMAHGCVGRLRSSVGCVPSRCA